MRIVILTQDDPFYLAENIDYFVSKLPKYHQVAGCVIFSVSPFGKRDSFIGKMRQTFIVFGFKFFMFYSIRFVINKLNPRKLVVNILKNHGIPIIKITGSINSLDSLIKIKELNPDILISIAGNQIFKTDLINLAPKGCLNLHSALLPKYRGLMPSFWVLKNQEKETGVSVFFVDEGIDSGPIIVQRRMDIGAMTQEELIKKTKKIGMDAIIEAIERIQEGNLNLIPNRNEEMTYFSFPNRVDVKEFYKAGKKFF